VKEVRRPVGGPTRTQVTAVTLDEQALQAPRDVGVDLPKLVSPHDGGVPGKVVAQLMGHANVDTTLNVYTQVLDGSVRAAVEKIADQLFTNLRTK
jgi:integrase